MTKTLFFAIGFLLFANVAFGCSYVKPLISDDARLFEGKPSLPAPKPAQYVFIGEVIEITKAAKPQSDENRNDAEGLKIKVDETIYSPKLTSYYEVLPLSINPDCSLQGVTDLSKVFPVGSKVRVIAQEATIYKKLAAEDSVIRLEASYKNDGSIIRNDLNENTSTSANSFYDYSKFVVKNSVTREDETIYYSNLELLRFELQKDLARLVKAKTESEKLKVMGRLVYFPYPYGVQYSYGVPYHRLAQAYLKKSKKRNALEAKWEEHKQLQQIRQNTQAPSK